VWDLCLRASGSSSRSGCRPLPLFPPSPTIHLRGTRTRRQHQIGGVTLRCDGKAHALHRHRAVSGPAWQRLPTCWNGCGPRYIHSTTALEAVRSSAVSEGGPLRPRRPRHTVRFKQVLRRVLRIVREANSDRFVSGARCLTRFWPDRQFVGAARDNTGAFEPRVSRRASPAIAKDLGR